MNFAAALQQQPVPSTVTATLPGTTRTNVVPSSTVRSNTTGNSKSGSVLHTPFVLSYMRRGGPNTTKKTTPVVTAAPTTTATNNDGTSTGGATTTTTTTAAAADVGGAVVATTTTQPAATTTATTPASMAMYETSIKIIRQIHTMEEFWETYDYMKRPHELGKSSQPQIEYHFFRVYNHIPIKPTWEDVRF
jgi:Eukaryotic initiation factor 4E